MSHLEQGSDLYVNWIVGSGATHDVFFTDPNIIASYREFTNMRLVYFSN